MVGKLTLMHVYVDTGRGAEPMVNYLGCGYTGKEFLLFFTRIDPGFRNRAPFSVNQFLS